MSNDEVRQPWKTENIMNILSTWVNISDKIHFIWQDPVCVEFAWTEAQFPFPIFTLIIFFNFQ